ncbi:hypothetical protein CEXT_279361 [Caerostris extrusa]|uniref:Uncharacterized protein n=1 Tax=Caerostris extrusa TaxID=172846 RepID=A0AAV4XET9_CAEEX|nr:hypothetical protein CEXT_279361 [Caerostris extrusa]
MNRLFLAVSEVTPYKKDSVLLWRYICLLMNQRASERYAGKIPLFSVFVRLLSIFSNLSFSPFRELKEYLELVWLFYRNCLCCFRECPFVRKTPRCFGKCLSAGEPKV